MFFLRQVNCLTSPERELVELFRLARATVPPYTLPALVTDAFWSSAVWGEEIRRSTFEDAFTIVSFTIDEIGFQTCLNLVWMNDYTAAILAGEAPITADCPCDSF